MRPLDKQIRAQDRTLKQIKREGMVALYELYGRQGLLYGFEVIIVKVHPEQEIMGRHYPEREGYPGNEDWGHLAWSYGRQNRAEAEDAFAVLCQKQAAGGLMQTDLEAR